jgi:dihydroneopterin triphosphate diphosphatase
MSSKTAAVPRRYKIPVSVLVVVYTPALDVLLMERAPWPGYWQSVTGSVDREDEPLVETAVREVMEETGIDARRHRLADWNIRNRFEIYRLWQSRYAPGVTHNTEHVFGLTVPERLAVRLEPSEHSKYVWLPWQEAAEKCFSWSNRDAILMLPRRAAASC